MLKDQRELLRAFNDHHVDYLIVGGHAVNAYGLPRATKDLDVLIRSEEGNAARVFAALAAFGAPLQGLTPADFCGSAEEIFQIGVEPHRIDILQSISGVPFAVAWAKRVLVNLGDDLVAPLIHKADLITNKISTGRPRDLADVAELREMDDEEPKLR